MAENSSNDNNVIQYLSLGEDLDTNNICNDNL